MPSKIRLMTVLSFVLCANAGCGVLASRDTLPQPDRTLTNSVRAAPYRLDNGMTILVIQDDNTNTLSLDLKIAAGSRDDPPGRYGLATLVQRALFTKTTGAPSALDQQLSAATVGYGAHVSFEDSLVSSFTYEPSAEAVLQSYRRILDGDCTLLSEAQVADARQRMLADARYHGDLADIIARAAFTAKHPYGHSPDGTTATIAALDLQSTCDFLYQQYIPTRATLTMSGSGPAVQRLLAATPEIFKNIRSRAEPVRPATPAIGYPTGRAAFSYTGASPAIALIFPFPDPFTSQTATAEYVAATLAAIMGQAPQRSAGIRWAGALQFGGRHQRVLIVLAFLEDEAARPEAEHALWALVEETQHAAANPLVFQMLRQELRLARVRAVESPHSRGMRYAHYQDAPPGYNAFMGDIRWFDAMTPNEVNAVSLGLLRRELALTLELSPRKESAELTAIQPRRAGEAFTGAEQSLGGIQGAQAPPAEVLVAAPEVYTLDNGLEVVLAPRSSFPVTELRLVIKAGQRDSPAEDVFLATIAAHALASPPSGGTLLLAGTGIDARVSGDTTTFTTRGLSIYGDHLIWGLSDHLLSGSYEESGRAALGLDEQPRRTPNPRKDQHQRTAEDFYRSLSGLAECPRFARSMPGEIDYTPQEMEKFRRAHYRADRSTLIVSGNFDVDLIKQHIAAAFGGRRLQPWGRTSDVSRTPNPLHRSVLRPVGVRSFVAGDDGSGVVELVAGFIAPESLAGDRSLQILLHVLVQEELEDLRRSLGLTFDVDVGHIPSFCGQHLFQVKITAVPNEATTVAREVAQRLHQLRGGQFRRLAQTRRGLLWANAMQFSDSESVADRMEYLSARDLPWTTERDFAADLGKITAADVTRALARLLDPTHASVLTVGPASTAQSAANVFINTRSYK